MSLLTRLHYGAIARFRPVTSVAVPAGVVRLTTRTVNEAHRAATLLTKEPETIAWIDGFRSAVPGGDAVFYDVGANIGVYSMYAAIAHPWLTVCAFEPDASSFASLCQNVALNRLARTMPYPFAIARDSGIDVLQVHSMHAGAGAAALGQPYAFFDVAPADVFRQGVFHVSLDQLVFTHGFPPPTFLKIDVDGLERDILAGAARVLGSPGLQSVLVELQYRTEDELTPVIAGLRAHGFGAPQRSDWIAAATGLSSRNFIFRREA